MNKKEEVLKNPFNYFYLIIPLLLFLPFLKIFLFQSKAQDFASFKHYIGINEVIKMFVTLLFSETTYNFFISNYSLLIILSFIGIFLYLSGLFAKNLNKYDILFKLYFLLPLLIIVLLSSFTKTKIYEVKYLIIFVPGFFYTISLSLCNMKSYLKYIFLLFILSLNLFGWYQQTFNPMFYFQDWRGAVGTINKYADKNDVVAVYPSMFLIPYRYYSSTNIDVFGFNNSYDLNVFKNRTDNKNRLWLLYVPKYVNYNDIPLSNTLNKKLEFINKFYFKNNISWNELYLVIYEIKK